MHLLFSNFIHGRHYITACNSMCNKQIVPKIGWQIISDRIALFEYCIGLYKFGQDLSINIINKSVSFPTKITRQSDSSASSITELQMRNSASAWLCVHFMLEHMHDQWAYNLLSYVHRAYAVSHRFLSPLSPIIKPMDPRYDRTKWNPPSPTNMFVRSGDQWDQLILHSCVLYKRKGRV